MDTLGSSSEARLPAPEEIPESEKGLALEEIPEPENGLNAPAKLVYNILGVRDRCDKEPYYDAVKTIWESHNFNDAMRSTYSELPQQAREDAEAELTEILCSMNDTAERCKSWIARYFLARRHKSRRR